MAMKTIPQENISFKRYEDLCTKTDMILSGHSSFIGTANELIQKPLDKEKFHDIGGNPMRFRREEIQIKLDEKWKNSLTKEELSTFKDIGSLNNKSGYNSVF